MTDRELTAAMSPLIDSCDDDFGDWADVLRRAQVTTVQHSDGGPARVHRPTRSGSAGRRRRVLLAVAAVLLAGLVLVSTGFGRNALQSLLGRIDVDFWRSEPAPSVVRWRFEDLAIGSPPSLVPQAIASEARTVGTLRVGGRTRTLWVAPTRKGGFCYELEDSFGGRRPGAGMRAALTRLSASPTLRIDPRPNAPTWARMLGVQGTVLGDEIEQLSIEFADGTSQDLDFLYVSSPIDAGFFGYTVPEGRQLGRGRPRFVVGRNSAGNVIARQRLPFPTRPPDVAPGTGSGPAGRRLPSRPAPAPSPPLQRGEAHGVSIVAGRNGSVLFDSRQITPERRALLDGGISYACFELVKRGGATQGRGLGQEARFQPTVGFRVFGIGTPFDGCEIQGGYGHRWPDKLGSHSAVEIPFTAAGRRFFTDRAAARDLALFLTRTPGMRHMRRAPTATFAQWLHNRFSPRVVELQSPSTSPPHGRIGYRVTDSGVLFRRVSPTGRVFTIVIGPKGGARSENVRPLAFIY